MNNDSILEWLRGRSINDETLSQFGVSWDNAIVIPVRDSSGQFLYNKYRRNPFLVERGPKYWYDKEGKVSLFGAEYIANEKTVLITEGELDALVLWSHKIPAVTSTGGAMSWQEKWNDLLAGKELYICLDNDFAGCNGAVKILSTLPHAKVILLPDTAQVKDVTDYYARGGDVRSLMAGAKHYTTREDVLADMNARKGTWQSVLFHEAWLEWYDKQTQTTEPKPVRERGDDVERARSVPITSIIKVGKNRKALCPFHNEKTPSLHVYQDNHAFCFGGCAKRYDAIDIYAEVNGVPFKEAVERMNKL